MLNKEGRKKKDYFPDRELKHTREEINGKPWQNLDNFRLLLAYCVDVPLSLCLFIEVCLVTITSEERDQM